MGVQPKSPLNNVVSLPERGLTAQEQEIIDHGISILSSKFAKGEGITSPEHVGSLFQLRLSHKEHEVFAVAFLDNKHRMIALEEMFSGTVDAAKVYPREVVKRVLQLNAAAVIFGHNHPSGDPTPSQSDRAITRRLKDALGLVDVRVLDHFVVGESWVSMESRGLI